MARRQSNIDWYSVFYNAFNHDGAVGGSSDDSPAPAPQAPATEPRNEFERRFGPGAQVDDDGPHFRLNRRAPPKAAAGLGLDADVPAVSKGVGDFGLMDQDEQGQHVSPKHRSKSSSMFGGQKKRDGQDDVGLGLHLSSPSKGVDFSRMDEDEQEEQVSLQQCSKSSPKFRENKNDGQLLLNERKSQGNGEKKKPYVNKRRAHAIDLEDSDYDSSLPSRSSERRKQQLQNSSFVHSQKPFKMIRDVVLLDDEDMEPMEEVNREMSDRLNEPKIYYPSRDDQEAVEVTRSDINCLDSEEFLSSPVINFYIEYIKRTRLCNENFRDKFYIFNTYFFGKLEETLYQPHDFPKLRRWWNGVNIFNNAYIILPIHAKEHWSLVIICLTPKEEILEPIILHLDSLGMHCSTEIFNTVGRYLENEWRFLSVAEPAWPSLLKDIRKETVQVPQQNNGYDCGIFMLYYIEKFIKEAPARFTADKLDMFSRSWFRPEEASGLRQRIRELLLQEFECASRLDQHCRISVAESSDERIKIKSIGVAGSDEGEKKGKSTTTASLPERLMGAEECASRLDQHCRISVAESSDERINIKSIGVAGSHEGEKKGKSTATASPPERLMGAEEVTGGTAPIPDAVRDNGVKRSEGNAEANGSSMPIPDNVFCDESTGTKIWITRIYRPTLEPRNRARVVRSGRDDDRRAFIECLSRIRYSCPFVSAPATNVAAAAEKEEENEQAGEEARGAVDMDVDQVVSGYRPIRKTKPNPKCFGPQWK